MNQAAKSIFMFVVLAYAISWAIWFAGFALTGKLETLQDERFGLYLLAGSFGPTIAALLTAGFTGGRSAVIALLKRVVQVKFDWKAHVFLFLALPVIGLLLYLILGVQSKIPVWQIAITLIPLGPINALFGGIIFGQGPLGEEMGWRGILQDKLPENLPKNLPKNLNAISSAIIVGLIWTFWHAPLFRFADFRNGLEMPIFIGLYALSLIFAAYAMAQIWRWSNGSLFATIFFHAVLNTTAIKLTDADWWRLNGYSNLQIFLMVLTVFGLTAVGAAICSRTVFRGQSQT